MTRPTLAELETTVRKAVRGHGCPWGIAEDAGRSARWLVSHGLPGAEAVAACIGERDGCCHPGAPCAMRRALAFGDRIDAEGAMTTDDASSPLLHLAQVGRAAMALDRTFRVEWDGARAMVDANALAFEAGGETPVTGLTCTPCASVNAGKPPSPASRDIEPNLWNALTRSAARLLVPSDDRSRAGAGAGTRDDD